MSVAMWCLPGIITGCFSLEINTGAFLSLPPTLKISSDPINGLRVEMGLLFGIGLFFPESKNFFPVNLPLNFSDDEAG